MNTLRNMLIAIALLAVSGPAVAGEKVAAYLDESSSSLGPNALTVLAMMKVDLESAGFTVENPPGTGPVFVAGSATRQALDAAGISRVFVLTALPLGEKLVVGLADRSGPALDVAYSDRMTASRVDELDTVIPRLVKSVVARKPAEEKATVQTVTDQEARVWRKKFGEFLWGIGIPFGTSLQSGAKFSYGLMFRFAYEMDFARIDVLSSFMGNTENDMIHFNFLGIEGHYLFLSQNITPFIGGGLAFSLTGMDNHKAALGLLFNVGGGVEFFRLYSTRLILDVRFGLPTYRMNDDNGAKRWVPNFMAGLSVLW